MNGYVKEVNDLEIRAEAVRKIIIDSVYSAGSSHVACALSIVEILCAIYNRVDLSKIKKMDEGRDRVILSKGHGVSALYAVLHCAGLLSDEDINNYCQNGTVMCGHASHQVKYIEHSTGALGHGASVGLGMAIGLNTRQLDGTVYVIIGDGELHEGSNWEAVMLAGKLKPNNLIYVIDNNGLSGIGTSDCCHVSNFSNQFSAFGFNVLEVDGHDQISILNAFDECNRFNGPSVVICNTVKGRGVSFMENNNVWHYRPINKDVYLSIKNEMGY